MTFEKQQLTRAGEIGGLMGGINSGVLGKKIANEIQSVEATYV